MRLEGEVGTRFYKQQKPVEIFKGGSDMMSLGTVAATMKLVEGYRIMEVITVVP